MSRRDDKYYPPNTDKLTLADYAKIIIGGIICLTGFYALTIIIFTL